MLCCVGLYGISDSTGGRGAERWDPGLGGQVRIRGLAQHVTGDVFRSAIVHGLLFMPYWTYPVTCSRQLLQQLLLLLWLLLPSLLSSPTRRRCPRRIVHGPSFMVYCSCRIGHIPSHVQGSCCSSCSCCSGCCCPCCCCRRRAAAVHGALPTVYRSGQLLQQLLLLLLLLLPLLLSSPTRRRCPRRIAHGPSFMIYCSCRVGLSATPSDKLHCPRVAACCCPACSSISHCHAELELAQGVTCRILDSCVAVCVRSHLASCRLVELPCSP